MSDINKEKRAEIIQDTLDYLDDDMLENVDKLRMGTKEAATKAGKGRKWFAHNHRYLAVAASVCLLIMGAVAWGTLIGPSDYQEAPRGTESGGNDYHKPENTPDLNEGMEEQGTEYNPGDVDVNIPLESEGASDGIPIDTESIAEPGDSTQEKPDEPDHYAPLGDVYQLTDNYVKVTMLPNKAWSLEATLHENFAKSREIEEKYYGIIDKFIEALCTTPLLETKMVMDVWNPPADTDIYHLFFQRTDGEIVQVCIFSDYGCVYFYDNQEYCMKIDGDILYEVLKVLWMHW